MITKWIKKNIEYDDFINAPPARFSVRLDAASYVLQYFFLPRQILIHFCWVTHCSISSFLSPQNCLIFVGGSCSFQ